MRFKNFIRISEGMGGPGGHTAMDPPPDQEKLAMLMRPAGAFEDFSKKELPPSSKGKNPLANYLPTRLAKMKKKMKK